MIIKDFFSKNFNELNREVNVYVCGPTTYDYAHIGNIRPVIVFDVLNRVVSLEGKFNYVHNLTDIDDKIINKAINEKKTERQISKFFIDKYLENLENLNIKKPLWMPTVSENISGMIGFIEKLIDSGYAYISEGDVYFSVKKWENYGKIDNINLDDLMNENVESSDKKKYKHDFALWKKTSIGEKYNSPWSMGRPGWHTECSYFVQKYFGTKGIDIHGGGIDLKFPHHINEMAQYESINKKNMSKNWIYVGHVNINNQKMSKSLGNFFTVKDFIESYGANSLRMLLLSNHYTKPLNVTENVIDNAVESIKKINNSLITFFINFTKENKELEFTLQKDFDFIEILKKDLDTPNALTYIFNQLKILNKTKELDIVNKIIFNLSLMGFKLETNFNIVELKEAVMNKNYQYLDTFRKKEII